ALAGRSGTGVAGDPRAPVAVAGLERGRLRSVLRVPELRGVERTVVAGRRYVPADRRRRHAVRTAALRRCARTDPAARVGGWLAGGRRGAVDAVRRRWRRPRPRRLVRTRLCRGGRGGLPARQPRPAAAPRTPPG